MLILVGKKLVWSDMRKGGAVWPNAAEIFKDCGNVMLSLIHIFKLKYYGIVTCITQFCHSNAHFNPLKGVFSDKPLIIAVI